MPDFYVDPDIAKAKTIHTDFYTDASVFQACKETIFSATWQFIGGGDLIREPGDAYPFTLLPGYLNEPLLLTRNQNNTINLLSNLCTHRGNLVVNKACKLNNLRCGYHGRMFSLDGKFASMPEFKEVENFPAEDDNLHQLPLFSWNKWLFTSINNKYPQELFFGEMARRVSWMPLDDFKFEPELSRTFNVKAHWALYCENYLEGFHIPFVHPGLNAVIDYGGYDTELFFPYSSLQLGLAKSNENCFDLPEASPDHGKNVAAYYFWVFPNMMFNFYPWGLSVNVVEPVAVDECRVCFYAYVWNESKLDKGAGGGLDKVEMEDE